MANKTYNKVIYGGKTLIDLSADTVTADTLLEGMTAHDKSGNAITGTLIVQPIDDDTPADNVVLTAISLDINTGTLTWTTPDDYSGGSTLALSDGALIQSADGDFAPGVMILEQDTGKVIVRSLGR